MSRILYKIEEGMRKKWLLDPKDAKVKANDLRCVLIAGLQQCVRVFVRVFTCWRVCLCPADLVSTVHPYLEAYRVQLYPGWLEPDRCSEPCEDY